MTDIVIYHNPLCGTSRNALAMIRNAGIEPHVVEYLKTPPSRALLMELIARAGITPRALLREKGTPYAEPGLGDETLTDEALVDAMMEHPTVAGEALGSLLFLALLGWVGAVAGGANPLKPVGRVVFWGALAMGLTAGIGSLVGKAI
ncbi:arsenate reductase family protein [Sphingobium phenoxybenzoativorans]|uniref:arsenate reductase family protein n=1 Tax=Sphingobium phenoxybenzoativorans TaxID=1592790 RepID=UPI001FEBA912|nr:arsenate reductase family protein [Sphingobium phenoxybenzoativorans]